MLHSHWQAMKYGDIISFFRVGYDHKAVYIGKNEKGEDTVVHFSGEPKDKANATVRTDLLRDVGRNYAVDNKLDSKYPVRSEEEMKATVNDLMKNGIKKYNLLTNNCEHLASLIRNGKRISPQVVQVQENLQTHLANEMKNTFGGD